MGPCGRENADVAAACDYADGGVHCCNAYDAFVVGHLPGPVTGGDCIFGVESGNLGMFSENNKMGIRCNNSILTYIKIYKIKKNNKYQNE